MAVSPFMNFPILPRSHCCKPSPNLWRAHQRKLRRPSRPSQNPLSFMLPFIQPQLQHRVLLHPHLCVRVPSPAPIATPTIVHAHTNSDQTQTHSHAAHHHGHHNNSAGNNNSTSGNSISVTNTNTTTTTATTTTNNNSSPSITTTFANLQVTSPSPTPPSPTPSASPTSCHHMTIIWSDPKPDGNENVIKGVKSELSKVHPKC